jgi:arylsulfatase A-like enzyme
MLGRVLDALEASAYKANTVIVLWSDHGWHLGEKLHWRKFTLWEEATRVPLIMVVPGLTKPGQQCQRPVSLIDIYQTLIDLCDLSRVPEIASISVVPLLNNPQRLWERPALTTWRRGNHAVRDDDWRYIRYLDGTEELYDHRNDPMEWINLAGDPQYATVKQRLAAWLPTTNAPDAPHEDQYDPQEVSCETSMYR